MSKFKKPLITFMADYASDCKKTLVQKFQKEDLYSKGIHLKKVKDYQEVEKILYSSQNNSDKIHHYIFEIPNTDLLSDYIYETITDEETTTHWQVQHTVTNISKADLERYVEEKSIPLKNIFQSGIVTFDHEILDQTTNFKAAQIIQQLFPHKLFISLCEHKDISEIVASMQRCHFLNEVGLWKLFKNCIELESRHLDGISIQKVNFDGRFSTNSLHDSWFMKYMENETPYQCCISFIDAESDEHIIGINIGKELIFLPAPKGLQKDSFLIVTHDNFDKQIFDHLDDVIQTEKDDSYQEIQQLIQDSLNEFTSPTDVVN